MAKEKPRTRQWVKHSDGTVERHWISVENAMSYSPTGEVVGGKQVLSKVQPVRAVSAPPRRPFTLGREGEIGVMPPEEGGGVEPGKPDIVSLTLHFKNKQSGIKRNPNAQMFLEGWIHKYVLRSDVEREIEKLEWEVVEVISVTQYYAIVNYLIFGMEYVQPAPDSELTDGPYRTLKYQYRSGVHGFLHKRTYEMGSRGRDEDERR